MIKHRFNYRESDVEDAEVSEEETQDEDERERAEMKRLEKDMEQPETQEQKDYKAEFFELLDEVLFLLGKTRGTDGLGAKKRRSLRDTSLRFHRRGSHETTRAESLIPHQRDERSRSICVPSMATLTADSHYGPGAVGSGKRSGNSSRKSSWTLGMDTQ